MNPLMALAVFALLSPVLGGSFYFNPENSVKDEVDKLKDISLSDIKDYILDLPRLVFEEFVVRIVGFIDSILEWIYNKLVVLNNIVDQTFYRFIINWQTEGAQEAQEGEITQGDFEEVPDYIEDSPVWMTWVLIKGVIVCFLWVAIIRLIFTALDVYKYVLDLIPFVG